MLNSEEKRYIELLMNTGLNRTRQEIVRQVWPNTQNISKKINQLNSNTEIQEEIDRRVEINKYIVPYTEKDIINRLLREADDITNGSGSSRLAAIKLLGEHIGMFVEKVQKEDSNITYNIINYSSQS